MEETALVQAPLEALLARLDELLEEWPDHPLLGQLRAICCRAMALPLDSPLKAVLTGLELLLQQAQVLPSIPHCPLRLVFLIPHGDLSQTLVPADPFLCRLLRCGRRRQQSTSASAPC